jgi:Peptidase family M23
MVDKRFSFMHSAVISFFAIIMIIVTTLLFFEYRFFCNQVAELMVVKQQYIQSIDVLTQKMNELIVDEVPHEISHEISDEIIDEASAESSAMMDEIMAAEASDEPDNDDDYVDDSFVVINRQPDYLKQSTIDYIQSQDLNALMTAIDVDRWSDYTDVTPVIAPQQKKSVIPKKAIVRSISRSVKDCGFMWPIDTDKFWLSSLFGPRKRLDGTWGFHHGIDMAAVKGTMVKAVRAGTVTEACFQSGYGNTVVVQHTDTIKTRYAHLHTLRVRVGQKVKQATVVGTVGETGFIRKKGKDGSHLHFEVYDKGKRINPLHCLPRIA